MLAGLKNIPQEHYEAATIDGANKIQSFIHITLPGLRFVLLISTLTYEIGFRSADLGRAVAVSLFPLPILAALIVGVTYLMDKRKDE